MSNAQTSLDQVNKLQKNHKHRRYKSLSKLLLFNIVYSIGDIYFGYALIYLSTIPFPTIVRIYGISMESSIAEGILVGIIPLGAMFGSFMAKSLLSRVSRRWCLLIGNLLAIIFGLLIYIKSFVVLIIMRLCQGFALGFISSMPPILTEQVTPRQVLAKFAFLPEFFICFGIFFSLLLKFVLSQATADPDGDVIWIYVFGYPIIILFFQSLAIIFIYRNETPKYYIQKGNLQKAKQSIEEIYKPEYVEQVFNQKLKDAHLSPADEHEITLKTLHSLNQSEKHGKHHHRHKKTLSQLSCSKLAIFTAYHLGVLQQFSGVGAVVIYGVQNTSKVYPQLKQIFPIIVNFQATVFCLFLPLLTRRFGRKVILQAGCIINLISTALIAIGFTILSQNQKAAVGLVMTGMIIFMGNYGLTIGSISFILISQIVQPRYVSYSLAFIWFSSFIVMFLFPIIDQKVLNNNPAILFYFFAFWSLISIIVNHKFVIETKGKTEAKIRKQYNQLCEVRKQRKEQKHQKLKDQT